MSACRCGEPLMSPSEQANGECLICFFSPPERTPEPLSTEAVLEIARKWYRIGVESRGHADDGHIAYHDLVRREAMDDAERDTEVAVCENCGSRWLFSTAPDRLTSCEACEVPQERDPWA